MLEFLDNIINPSEEFTAIPFWFFNDEPDKEKIRQQLTDYVDKGVEGIVLHPRIGIPKEISYLSEAYFEVVKYVVVTAERLGMKIVLYDEGMYPSGSAHGLVVAENAEYASKGIVLSDSAEGGQVITQFSDGRYLIYGFTHGTVRGIHYGEDDGEVDAPMSADILNPDAVDTFIRLTHERYYQELKEYFGNTIIAFFTDEPCPLGRNAGGFREWVPGMEAEILAENGSLEELEALFSGRENVTTQIYHGLIKKYLRKIYYARLSGWCESHGISLMGHPEASDDVEEEFYFHIPGQDLIMRRIAPESGGLREFDSVQAKLPADIARYLGRRRNANECFGVCNHRNIPWYFKGYDMKWYINWLGIRGVNLFVPHAFYYSVEGARKEERPPDVGPNNIWWSYYRLFSDYMKRLSYLMTDSESLARVAVLCDNNRVPAGELAGLYEQQIDFHYLPIAMLKDTVIKNGRLCIGGCEFEVVIDVYGYRKKEVYAEKLNGVRVVTDAAMLYPKGIFKTGLYSDIPEGCRTVATEKHCPALRVVHRKKDGAGWYLFSNEGETEIETNVLVKELLPDRKPFLLNLWDGTWEKSGGKKSDSGMEIVLKLEHCEMKLLLFLTEEEEKELRKRGVEFITAQELSLGDWTDRFTLISETENTAMYRYIYEIEEGGADEKMAFTEAAYFTVCGDEMVECECNKTAVGVSFYGPHKFRIGRFLKKGVNEIRLRVTGNAANIYGNEKVPFGLFQERKKTAFNCLMTELGKGKGLR